MRINYKINIKKSDCIFYCFKYSTVSLFVLENAEVVTESFIGSGKTALKATMYHFTRDNLDVHLTMADDGCIPVMVEGNGITQTGGKLSFLY